MTLSSVIDAADAPVDKDAGSPNIVIAAKAIATIFFILFSSLICDLDGGSRLT